MSKIIFNTQTICNSIVKDPKSKIICSLSNHKREVHVLMNIMIDDQLRYFWSEIDERGVSFSVIEGKRTFIDIHEAILRHVYIEHEMYAFDHISHFAAWMSEMFPVKTGS